jgi:2-polyprenyl-3-methyl-5-hydroxy-6-metoxy-1,4-benzoquinol methylase
MATPTYVEFARDVLTGARAELVDRFGRDALEETAYAVYTNPFPPAAYLGWNRVAHAQGLLKDVAHTRRALDFGSGLGVMLPYLCQRFREVVAFDLDVRPTRLMIERMHLSNVSPRFRLDAADAEFDAVVALDVLEHVADLAGVYDDLLSRTAAGGSWVISGPTENWLYRAMRRITRTSGEGHVRNVYDVFDSVPANMRLTRSVRLPFGSPVPLFLVGRFDRTA